MVRKSILYLVILAHLVQLNTAEKKKCRALVLEGGGDKGAWQGAAIAGLVKNLPKEEVQYDVISGVSVGSLNGFAVASHEKGDEEAMAKYIIKTWKDLKTSDLFTYWGGSKIESIRGFWDKPSFLDNSPMKKSIAKQVDSRSIKRHFSIGVTDATTAQAEYFSAKDLSTEDLKTIMLASTSMPAVFPYVKYKGSILIDGGVLLNADVRGAIHKCLELVDSEEDIIVDSILPTGAEIDYFDPSKDYTAYQMYNRYKELSDYRLKLSDIFHAYNDFPKANWRYTLMPLEKLPSSTIPIFFSDETVDKMIEMGYDHAKRIIENPNLTDLGKLEDQKKAELENAKGKTKSFRGTKW